MPLLLTVTQPLRTPAGLEVTQAYALINKFSYDRLLRRVDFWLGYYVHEAASLPGSGLTTLPLNLPVAFSFLMSPEQAGAASEPQAIMEAYAASELAPVLGEGATLENVP